MISGEYYNRFPWYLTHTGFNPFSKNWIRCLRGRLLFLLYNLQYVLDFRFDKESKNVRKKKVSSIQKTFNAIFKDGFNPVLGSIQRLPNQ